MSKRFVLLEPGPERLDFFNRLDAWVCKKFQDILEVVPFAPKSAIWISFSPKSNDDLLKAVVGKVIPPGGLGSYEVSIVERCTIWGNAA